MQVWQASSSMNPSNSPGQTSVDYPGGIHHSDFTGPGLGLSSPGDMQTLFSPTHIVPDWAFYGSQPGICIVGRSTRPEEVEKYSWSCVFGDMEVPAIVIGVGVLECKPPIHDTGAVPLWIKCSNGLSCLAGYFEFRQIQDFESNCLTMRLRQMLCTTPSPCYIGKCSTRMLEQCARVSKVLELESNDQSQDILKKSLRDWLLEKMVIGGDATILDAEGQGVPHLFGALGFDWAIKAIFESGVINLDDFVDVQGFTTLDWAKLRGRNEVVELLESYVAGTSISSIHPSIENQDIEQILQDAKSGWLKGDVINMILLNHQQYSFPHHTPPISGSLFLFDKNMTHDYRKDGLSWYKDSSYESRVQEFTVWYACGKGDNQLKRRCYNSFKVGAPTNIFLVHYYHDRPIQVSNVNSNDGPNSSGGHNSDQNPVLRQGPDETIHLLDSRQ